MVPPQDGSTGPARARPRAIDGVVMLWPERTVTVTQEVKHQAVLRHRLPSGRGSAGVVVELQRCVIATGKQAGRTALEVRLDGYRVGELTYRMSERYGQLVDSITARGGRPACEAVLRERNGVIEVELRLPAILDPEPAPGPLPGQRRTPPRTAGTEATQPLARPADHRAGARAGPGRAARRPPGPRRLRQPHWIGIGIGAVGLLTLIVVGFGTSRTPSPTTATADRAPPPATSLPAPTTGGPQPEPSPPPKPTEPRPARTTASPPPQAPRGNCHKNYGGCVPIASDVDCAGGGGDGPAYVRGPVRVLGPDVYGLDRDKNGIGCE